MDWRVAATGIGLMIFAFVLSLSAIIVNVKRLQTEAAALRVELKDLNEKLGHRFAYVTADMDSAKTQIRGISDGLERLNMNAAKVVKYLESKDRGKNARQK